MSKKKSKKTIVTEKKKSNSPKTVKTVKTSKTISTTKVAPTVSKTKSFGSTATINQKNEQIFSRKNYLWMAIGAGLIALGLIMMLGGKMPSPDVWDESIIYNPRITVVGPILILTGLVVEIYAIFKD